MFHLSEGDAVQLPHINIAKIHVKITFIDFCPQRNLRHLKVTFMSLCICVQCKSLKWTLKLFVLNLKAKILAEQKLFETKISGDFHNMGIPSDTSYLLASL